MKKHTSMALLVCALALCVAGAHGQVGSTAVQWPRFQDDTHGLSFAYPPELRPVILPTVGIEGWVRRVSLLNADDASGIGKLAVVDVNVFVCGQPGSSPYVPCRDEGWYRPLCDRFKKLPVGDGVGIQCVTYSRGACSWSVAVLRKKGHVEISAPAAEHAANLKTRDRAACADEVVAIPRTSPIREVLASFRFQGSK